MKKEIETVNPQQIFRWAGAPELNLFRGCANHRFAGGFVFRPVALYGRFFIGRPRFSHFCRAAGRTIRFAYNAYKKLQNCLFCSAA